MSEINNGGADSQAEGSSQETQDSVSKRAFEEVSKDMHKYKKELNEFKQAYNELQTQLKLQEEVKMQEQEQWKELYQKTKSEIEQEKKRADEQVSRYTKSVKISALKTELGGKIKDEYLSFANLNDIVITESGSVDTESLHRVANQFRQEHGTLIPKSENTNITGQAPNSFDNLKPKSLNQMSHEEKLELLKQLHTQKQ